MNVSAKYNVKSALRIVSASSNSFTGGEVYVFNDSNGYEGWSGQINSPDNFTFANPDSLFHDDASPRYNVMIREGSINGDFGGFIYDLKSSRQINKIVFDFFTPTFGIYQGIDYQGIYYTNYSYYAINVNDIKVYGTNEIIEPFREYNIRLPSVTNWTLLGQETLAYNHNEAQLELTNFSQTTYRYLKFETSVVNDNGDWDVYVQFPVPNNNGSGDQNGGKVAGLSKITIL